MTLYDYFNLSEILEVNVDGEDTTEDQDDDYNIDTTNEEDDNDDKSCVKGDVDKWFEGIKV